MKDTRLTIGLTSFNRRDLLVCVAESLAQVRHIDSARIFVLDDCSTEFDLEFLRDLFPNATVLRNERNSGRADFAIHQLWSHFVETGSGYLLSLDSDLLASRNLIDKCREIILNDVARPEPCLYDLFNTPNHEASGECEGFLVKRTVGSAGTLWRHDLLAEVLANIPASGTYDWDWSAHLRHRGIPIRVTRKSYVQHIGTSGQNTRSVIGMDHGEGFEGYAGHNLAVFLDQTREGLLRAIAVQKAQLDHQSARLDRQSVQLDKQSEAIRQLSQVMQTQGQVLQQVIAEVCASQHS